MSDRQGIPETEPIPPPWRYRFEISSVEGPEAFHHALDQADELDFRFERISQGSGIDLLTDVEITTMLDLGQERAVDVVLWAGPRAGWGIGVQPTSAAGRVAGAAVVGGSGLRAGLADVERGAALGLRGVLVADLGLLALLGEARARGDLPPDLVLKTSVSLPVTNPRTASVLVALGADTLNVATDLTVEQLGQIRAEVDVPLDVYVEAPDDFGGAVRGHEIADIVAAAAPVYLKYAVRNAPGLYPTGQHLSGALGALVRERVRRAHLGALALRRLRVLPA